MIDVRLANKEESDFVQREIEKADRYSGEWDSGPTFIIVHRDEIISYARHWRPNAHTHCIVNVTTQESYRGNKLGLVVISQIILSEPDVNVWYLDCKPHLTHYYEILGFQITDWENCLDLRSDKDPPEQKLMVLHKKNLKPLFLVGAEATYK